jgi:hypothetical protein
LSPFGVRFIRGRVSSGLSPYGVESIRGLSPFGVGVELSRFSHSRFSCSRFSRWINNIQQTVFMCGVSNPLTHGRGGIGPPHERPVVTEAFNFKKLWTISYSMEIVSALKLSSIVS